jgi:hypothetical protein
VGWATTDALSTSRASRSSLALPASFFPSPYCLQTSYVVPSLGKPWPLGSSLGRVPAGKLCCALQEALCRPLSPSSLYLSMSTRPSPFRDLPWASLLPAGQAMRSMFAPNTYVCNIFACNRIPACLSPSLPPLIVCALHEALTLLQQAATTGPLMALLMATFVHDGLCVSTETS